MNWRKSLSTGLTFGLVTIFLALIGFTTILAELLTPAFIRSNIPGMILVIGLLGLWNGVQATRHLEEEWGRMLVPGLVAGVLYAVLFGTYALVVGSLIDGQVDVRSYLPQLGPDQVRLLLLRLDTVPGAISLAVLVVVASILGTLLVHRSRRGAWGAWLRGKWSTLIEWLVNLDWVVAIRNSPVGPYVPQVTVAVILLAMPLVLGQYWNYNLGTVGIYILLGLGLNIVVGMAGLLDLGYVAFYAIGAYTVGLLTAPAPHNLQWSFWIAVPIGIALAAMAGVLLGIPVLRMRGDYLAIVTLGFGEIIRILAKSDALTAFAGGPRGVRGIGRPELFGLYLGSEVHFMYFTTLAVLLAIFITIRLQSSRVGRAWVAMREDESVAQAMGINTLRYKLLAFGIGAAFAGLGGALFASRNAFTGPEDHSLLVSINVLAVVIVGGMGSIPGVITGAFALKGLPEMLRQLEDYRILVFGGLMVVMMILRPEGLWPSAQRQSEFHKENTGTMAGADEP